MSTSTLTAPVVAPAGVAETLRDDILMGAAVADAARIARVGSSQRSALQSHRARAWTMGGDVD